MDNSPLIFISYATPDRDRVTPFHDHLRHNGYDVWMDFKQLKGGQNWDLEIKRALNRASLILMFISKNSVDRRGYVQREIKIALDKSQDKLVDDIYIIPVMMDSESDIPEQLSDIHFIDGNDEGCTAKIEEAIAVQFSKIGAMIKTSSVDRGGSWEEWRYKEEWDGLPGYLVEFNIPRFTSTIYPKIFEISEILKADMIKCLQKERGEKLFGSSSHLNFGMERFFRTNTWESYFELPSIKGKCISIIYSVSWYGAGAAHPNYDFLTYNFVLDPLVRIEDAKSLLKIPEESFVVLQDEVRRSLLGQDFSENSDGSMRLDSEYVNTGTEDWADFDNFSFDENGISFHFGNYQVAPYVFGPQVATLPYSTIVNLLHDEYAHALGIAHMKIHLSPG